jgi:hypothetical protein
MKVTKIATGYYKITNKENEYYTSYVDFSKEWILEVLVDNSKYGMMNTLEHVASLPTLKECKLVVKNIEA